MGMSRAKCGRMNVRTIAVVWFVLGCHRPEMHRLPGLNPPENAWVVRESFQGPGPDRTGNWRGWFDRAGCWWEEHNTWLIVTDEDLVASSAQHLHWNAIRPEAPWFCLSDVQVQILRAAVQSVSKTPPNAQYSGPVERWIIQNEDRHRRVAVVSRGTDGGGWSPILRVSRELAAMSVWGQSPDEQ